MRFGYKDQKISASQGCIKFWDTLCRNRWRTYMVTNLFNLLATDFFQILAHFVFKIWVIQKPNKVALWNKRHFEEKRMEIIQHV